MDKQKIFRQIYKLEEVLCELKSLVGIGVEPVKHVKAVKGDDEAPKLKVCPQCDEIRRSNED